MGKRCDPVTQWLHCSVINAVRSMLDAPLMPGGVREGIRLER